MRRIAQPLRLRSGLVLRNRLAKAAMTEGVADRRGRPGPRLERLYARWAAGGAGLLLTGNAMVDGRYLERAGNVVIEDPGVLASLAAWSSASRKGGAALVQLSHAGRQTSRFVSGQPVAPSAVAPVRVLGSFSRPRAMTAGEIGATIERFAFAADACRRAGFDGVQVHAAHGYLLSQFLSPLTNRRDDEWGGPPENRARLLLAIVRAVRSRTGPGFTIAVKLNSADFQRGGFSEEDSLRVIGWLDAEGVDLLEISGGNYESPALFLGPGVRSSTVAREAYFLEFARRVRGVTRMPLMVTGGFRSAAAMEAALEEDALDVVGLARPLALEPDLPARLLAGEADGSRVTPVGPRGRVLGMLAEASWFGEQLERLADGLDPDPTISPYASMGRYLAGQVTRGLRHRMTYRPRGAGDVVAGPGEGADA
jgi:2,4-dienoyl-CoA reductase-like NADH-dependent reductase (Old Yellow Enzyme family)